MEFYYLLGKLTMSFLIIFLWIMFWSACDEYKWLRYSIFTILFLFGLGFLISLVWEGI